MRDAFHLKIDHLTIGFHGRQVLEVPRFELARSQKVLLTGESGCGKSIFLRALLGVLPESAVWSGVFRLQQDGGEAKTLAYPGYRRQSFLRRRMSVVFQDAVNSLHPYRPVGRQCRGYATPQERRKWEEFRLNPDDLAEHMPGECSGGECQRLSLLFPYFDAQRDLLVMDEPLTDIDWISRKNIEACLKHLLGQPERTVILVTHQPGWLPRGMAHHAVVDGVLRPADWPGRRTVERGAAGHGNGAAPDADVLMRIRVPEPYSFAGNGAFSLRPFELELRCGESLGLIGESGCGKSTLLRIAAGLFPGACYPSRFEVGFRFDPGSLRPLMAERRQQRYRRLQLVQQNTTGTLIADETVGGNLRWIRRLKGLDRGVFEAAVGRWGQKLRLFSRSDELADRKLSELSVGMLRRYVLLRAFLLLDIYGEGKTRPKLLLLDEISRGLDAANVECLIRALREFQHDHNVGILAVSHDIDFIRECCDGFRMMFRGLLLPEHFVAEDLLNVENNSRVRELRNPYYHDFLARREESRNRSGVAGFGCLYGHHFVCRNRDHRECQHASLIERRKVGTCC